MGQNSSFHLSITDVIRDWVPIAKDSAIFINRNTRQHLQRFIVQVPLPELLREVTIYNARIQATYHFVCKVAYFNQVPSEDDSKGFRSFAVYTDHILPIREGDWTRTRFMHALEAVLTLTGYYGFFRLTEGMMGVNQRGETKVWISDSPANNHRDCVFTTEEQAVSAFVNLALRRNSEVASILINCVSLQELKERLARPQRKTSTPFQNFGRNIQEEREVPRKDYKNVFNEENKEDGKKYQAKFMLPASALFSNGRNKDELKPSSYSGNNQSALSGRTVSQYNKVTKPTGSQFFKRRPQSKKIGETSFDNFAKLPKHAAMFDSIPHFQTTNDFATKFTIPSPTNKQHAKPQTFAPDITIINNNVSHVVNNITHNHPPWSNLRQARTPEFVGQRRNESVSPLARRQQRDKLSAPKFIQQRKQSDNPKQNIKSFYANTSEKSSGIINTPKSLFTAPQNFNSTHGSNNTNTQESFKNAELEWNMQPSGRKPQKLYTFCRPVNGKSPPKQYSTFISPHAYPLTPPANTQTAKNGSSFFKKPSRTLTTEFNEPPPKMESGFVTSNHKNFTIERQDDIPQKSLFFQNESSTLYTKPFRQKIVFNQTIPQDVAEALPTSKSIALNAVSGKSLQSSLKNQLKLQFSSLLGSQPKLQRKEESAIQTPPQSNLKEKIQQKKMAFAQLKKQALAVLTDIL